MATLIDLDEALAELDPPDPVKVRLFGRTWELPATAPAAVIVRVTRIREEHGPDFEIDHETAFKLALDVIPRPVLDEMTDAGLSDAHLAILVHRLLIHYFKAATEGKPAAAKKAAAKKKPGSSSTAGRSSKRTSVGSMGSPSPKH